MKILVLNGSPRKHGTVATLLRAVVDGLGERHEIQWIDVYDLKMQPCIGCMKCRANGVCRLSEDDGHRLGRLIGEADGLIVGTPTHWGNMTAQLKLLFDRNVPVFIRDQAHGYPIPLKKANRRLSSLPAPRPGRLIFSWPKAAELSGLCGACLDMAATKSSASWSNRAPNAIPNFPIGY